MKAAPTGTSHDRCGGGVRCRGPNSNGGANTDNATNGDVASAAGGFATAVDVDGVFVRGIGGTGMSPSALTRGERRVTTDGVPVSTAPENVRTSRGIFRSLTLSLSPGFSTAGSSSSALAPPSSTPLRVLSSTARCRVITSANNRVINSLPSAGRKRAPDASSASSRASLNSAALVKRSSRFFSNALCATRQMPGSALTLTRTGDTTCSCKMRSTVRNMLSALNSRRPASISHNTMPAANTSERASRTSPRTCSGLMYAYLPLRVPASVSLTRIAAFAMPKSTSLVCPS